MSKKILSFLLVAALGWLACGFFSPKPRKVKPDSTEAAAIVDRVNRYCYSHESDARTCELYVHTLADFVDDNGFNTVQHEQITQARLHIPGSGPVESFNRAAVDPVRKPGGMVGQAVKLIDAAAQAATTQGQTL